MKLLRIPKNSIAFKMLVPMMIVLIVQSSLFLSTVLFGGTLRQLNNNAFDILNERVINRKIDLQNLMLQWSNLGDSVQLVNSTVQTRLEEAGLSTAELVPGGQVTNAILTELIDPVIYMLRRRGVTGAYVIFDGMGATNRRASRAGIYLRDYDPSNGPNDNSDLLSARAPAEIIKEHGIALDTYWQPQFSFSEDTSSSSAFYFMPYDAALRNPGLAFSDLGYWSPPHALGPSEMESISYTVPLLMPDGTPYGVLGVSISTDYLRKVMPYGELDTSKDAAYLLAIENGTQLNALFSSGPAYQRLFGGRKLLERGDHPIYGDTYVLRDETSDEDQTVYGCLQYLNLYNSNTPFAKDQWSLVGIEDEQQLLSFSDYMQQGILTAVGLSLLLGLICLIFISRIFTRPISGLVEQVEQSDPNLPVRLDKTNIYEFDRMSTAIESLSRNVADAASRLSQIIDLTSFSIGAFEYDPTTKRVFFTNRFFSVFGLPEEPGSYLSATEFHSKMEPLVKCVESENVEGGIYVFCSKLPSGATVWARLTVVTEDGRTLGVAEDITQEMVEKRKIEYERDYDLLTNLLNRRAFHSTMADLFLHPQTLGVSALIMLDLDNLKYINDTYGHDYGDQYICCMAQILKSTAPHQAVISRMSGDEFYVFLHGYSDKEPARAAIQSIRDGVLNALFPLPNNANFRVRASAGVAWYPDDSTISEDLIRYADFAMYTVKNTVKGEFAEFDKDGYRRDAYLLQGREELNRLIDGQLLDYHFQPIVDARTGEVFAYEALMRPRIGTLRNPAEILNLAHAQSKLYQIERLTMFLAMKAFLEQIDLFGGCRIFINSIANQMLSERDLVEFEATYRPYLHRLVVEFTEDEKLDGALAKRKQDYLHEWNAQLALDDYGTGYNGDTSLLHLKPAYVKVDISIVQNIDKDSNRLKILQNLISYTRERRIKVIAEGVETQAELLTLIENGVDYLQGYYLARPAAKPAQLDGHVAEEIRAAAREACKNT